MDSTEKNLLLHDIEKDGFKYKLLSSRLVHMDMPSHEEKYR